jgi:hypothetical protein
MKIGDKVKVDGNDAIVVDVSTGWNPALYRVKFSDGEEEWVQDFDNRGNEQHYGSFKYAKMPEKVNFT